MSTQLRRIPCWPQVGLVAVIAMLLPALLGTLWAGDTRIAYRDLARRTISDQKVLAAYPPGAVVLLNNEPDLVDFYRFALPDLAPPEVDFEQQAVLAVFGSQSPCGGSLGLNYLIRGAGDRAIVHLVRFLPGIIPAGCQSPEIATGFRPEPLQVVMTEEPISDIEDILVDIEGHL